MNRYMIMNQAFTVDSLQFGIGSKEGGKVQHHFILISDYGKNDFIEQSGTEVEIHSLDKLFQEPRKGHMPEIADNPAVLLIPEMVAEQFEKRILQHRRNEPQRQGVLAGDIASDLTEQRLLILCKSRLEPDMAAISSKE